MSINMERQVEMMSGNVKERLAGTQQQLNPLAGGLAHGAGSRMETTPSRQLQGDHRQPGSSPRVMTRRDALSMSGFLYKKSAGKGALKRRNWKRRWFAIEDSINHSSEVFLVYFENNKSKTEKGRVPLSGYRVHRMDPMQDGMESPGMVNSSDAQGKYARRFELTPSDSSCRHLQLEADSVRELGQWIAALAVLTRGGGMAAGGSHMM
jgi:hypothetical protein